MRTILKLTMVAVALCAGVARAGAQDEINIISDKGNAAIKLAPAPFKPMSGDAGAYKATFDAVLENDLKNSGIFNLVSKSLQPTGMPGAPSEMNVSQWAAPPTDASYVAFGAIGLQGGRVVVSGWLYDTHNVNFPQVVGKQYTDLPTENNVRQIAHKFADEIILRLGGGLAGIAETKIYYVARSGANKEIWVMDYDGANKHALTSLGTVSISPRVSPDNSRIAFSSLGREGFQIRMYSLLLGRMVAFPTVPGTNLSPAWSAQGQLAFSSSRTGDPEIWVSDAAGGGMRRVTSFRGPDVSPTWNPKTGSQIAWISGRTGLPQLYTMDADGAGVSRLTDGGYATSPSWSPNGKFITFAWNRKYGPGAPGGQDIYIMELGTNKWIQLTHDVGRCDFPSWAPDGRHIVFAVGGGRGSEIWTMLADGTERHKLADNGDMPNWSWK